MPRRLAPLALAAALAVAACDSAPPTISLEDRTESGAAPADVFALYALGRGTSPEDVSTARLGLVRVDPDSFASTTRWDVGFQGTDVILNSGASGPGAAVGTVVDEPFEEVEDASALAVPFRRDGESVCPEGPARVVCDAEGSPFALFRSTPDGPAPIPGRTLVFRLGNAQGFAKLQVESYDADAGTVTVRYLVNPFGPLLRDGAVVAANV